MFIENGLHTTWYDIAVRIIKAVRTRVSARNVTYISREFKYSRLRAKALSRALPNAMTVLAAYYRAFGSSKSSGDRDRSAIIHEFYPSNVPE
ncbi:hypothetical protein ALC53_04776 [Atta colombica]|uniref:Uncharacterized protein n=1 Tax=Atta colombica TaxID=520822 RepID=A0A195BK06_9HYME|nr:hypothetical protein ALC53_04776 [Atta colombica]